MTKIKMGEKDRHTYQESLKDYRDLKSAIDTSGLTFEELENLK